MQKYWNESNIGIHFRGFHCLTRGVVNDCIWHSRGFENLTRLKSQHDESSLIDRVVGTTKRSANLSNERVGGAKGLLKMP